MAMGRACDLPLRRHALIKPYGNQKGAWRFAYCVRAMQRCQGFSVTTPIREADFIACQIKKLASSLTESIQIHCEKKPVALPFQNQQMQAMSLPMAACLWVYLPGYLPPPGEL